MDDPSGNKWQTRHITGVYFSCTISGNIYTLVPSRIQEIYDGREKANGGNKGQALLMTKINSVGGKVERSHSPSIWVYTRNMTPWKYVGGWSVLIVKL